MSTTKNYAGIPDKFAQLETAKVVLMELALGKKDQTRDQKLF